MSSPHPQQELLAQVAALRAQLRDIEHRLGASATAERPLPSTAFHVLVCRVGDERVGLWLAEVREVVPVALMVALPEAPPWIAGLLELGGTALPVIDVAGRFARTGREVGLGDLVVICRGEPRDTGLVVQEVFDVRVVEPEAVVPPAREIPQGPYLRGAIRDPEGLLLLLSLERLIESSDVPELSEGEA